jgi:DNA polymerase elongation subunit (family B)
MLELLDSIKGIEVIYGDTDSVYYNILPNFD